MSQENVEVIRRSFETFNREGAEALVEGRFWSPELVLDATRTEIPGLGVYRGLEEVRTFFEEDWFQAFPFEEWAVEVEELIDHGDRVIAMSYQRGRGASSGVAAQLELGNIFTVRSGEIVRIDLFRDRAEALEAAGLRE